MDLQSAVAYTFRREVPLHSIVSGAAFSALTQFVQLLEQVHLYECSVVIL